MQAGFREQFLRLALDVSALRFGQFTLKSGRTSPYFFNAGAFCSGRALAGLARAYAQTLTESAVEVDMLFGPAYKGIPLVAALACAMAQQGRDIPYAFNRKEAKDHGEGGLIVGAPLQGRVLIVDDVISAGTSVRESVALIAAQGATPAAVLIALDRQERGQEQLSAAQEVQAQFGIPVLAVARLSDLLTLTRNQAELTAYTEALTQYRKDYGVA